MKLTSKDGWETSEDGISVQFSDRNYLVYRDCNGRILPFYCERVLTDRGGVVFEVFLDNKMVWEPPHQDELITELEKKKILDNLVKIVAARPHTRGPASEVRFI